MEEIKLGQSYKNKSFNETFRLVDYDKNHDCYTVILEHTRMNTRVSRFTMGKWQLQHGIKKGKYELVKKENDNYENSTKSNVSTNKCI